MPIRIRNRLNDVDRARFEVHAAAFESYITYHQRRQVQVGERNHEKIEVIEFGEAEITYVTRLVARAWPYQIETAPPFILRSVSRILTQARMSPYV